VITVTATEAAAGALAQIKLVADALQQVHSTRFQPAQVIVVHPRRWGFWSAATDSQNRPLMVPTANGPFNSWSGGSEGLSRAQGVVGSLFGVPVLVSPNVPTTLSHQTLGNQDCIIVTRASDLRLYEDDPMPRRVRFEETLAGSLTVKIVAWDYSGWAAGRYPSGSRVLSGSGLKAANITF
jgi:hypothetical protein